VIDLLDAGGIDSGNEALEIAAAGVVKCRRGAIRRWG
jgi:hypothetical protein